jgi:stage V sporulation protein R
MEPRINVFRGIMLDKEWTEIARNIAKFCIENYKLSLPDIDFHIINAEELYSITATHGWIVYPQHWLIGQNYLVNKMEHELGYTQIFEIVVPSGVSDKNIREPVDAYIYDASTDVAKKLVISHVYGHAHMFEVNPVEKKFKHESPRGFLAYARKRLMELEQEIGEEEVEKWMDIADSLSTLVDLYPMEEVKKVTEEKDFLSKLVETPEERRERLEKELEEKTKKPEIPPKRNFDVMKFIIDNSRNLTPQQREILNLMYLIKRKEYSQALNHILHEGFAALVNLKYGLDADLPIGEVFDWMKMTMGVASQPRDIRMIGANPYWLGMNLLLDVIDKWDKGKYGLEWENLTDLNLRREFNKKLNQGWDKVLEITKTEDDYSFIDNYFTKDFFDREASHLLVFSGDEPKQGEREEDTYTIISRAYEDVKNTLLFRAYNAGLPRIAVEKGGGNYNDNGELYLVQELEGYEKLGITKGELTLDPEETKETLLKALYVAWGRRVHLETVDKEGNIIVISTYDGKNIEVKKK